MEQKKRIMVLRFSALGDVAMTLPVIYSLATEYPDVEVLVVTRPFFAKMFLNAPQNLTLVPIDFKQYKGVGGIWRLLKKLSEFKPDYVADLHNVVRTWIIDSYFRLRGVKVAMVDKMRSRRGRLFKHGEAQPSFIDRYCKVFSTLGFPVKLSFSSLFREGEAVLPVNLAHPAIGIAPNARYYTKTYPTDKVKELIGILTDEGFNVYLFGGPGEEAVALEAIASEYPKCFSLAGQFRLPEELALMSGLDLMISMDSANQHLAALTAIPVVTVWGATTPACGFMPYGQSEENSVMEHVDCQPCSVAGGPVCPRGDFKCMRRLSPDTIVAKVKNILKL